jgi:hypothetical protein
MGDRVEASALVVGHDPEVQHRLQRCVAALQRMVDGDFAYLMASDAKDVLVRLVWTEHVVVELHDHHDSDVINAGLAADAGYRGTFGQEAAGQSRDRRRRRRATASTTTATAATTGPIRCRAEPRA